MTRVARGAATIAGCCVSLVASPAAGLDPPFGAAGQVVLSTNASAGVSWTAYDASGANYFRANLGPSFDYFFARNVSIGADASGSYALDHSYYAVGGLTESTLGAASGRARVGVNIAVGRWVSWYPQLSVGLSWSRSQVDTATALEQAGPDVTLFAPLLLHVRSHLFVGFGPFFFHAFDHVSGPAGFGGQLTNIGLNTVLGGYVGGERADEDVEIPVQYRAFGEEHEIVIDGGAFASWLSSQDASPWSVGLGLSAGVDFFVIEHVSMGVGASASYSYSRGTDASSGSPVTTERSSGGLVLRLGYDIPLSPAFSLYPRAGLGAGLSSYDLIAAGGTNQSTAAIVYVSLYAPILCHVAPHFFVGFGPFVTREILDQNVGYQEQNRATSVGASLTVGGWL